MTKIRTTPRTGRSGAVSVDEHPDDRRYVALRHLKIGGETREPGSLVGGDDLKGRNVGSMIRNGEIQQVIEPAEPDVAKPRTRAAR